MSKKNEIKVILLGSCGVGKTNIISRYVKNQFDQDSISTAGANYALKHFPYKGVTYSINIWDTAGQEQYRAVTKMFIQDTNILILCYSITDRESFNELDYWYNAATDIVGNSIIIGVAGNKSDLINEEVVSDDEGENYANKVGAKFRLISAKTNKESIDQMFEMLIQDYLKSTGVDNGETAGRNDFSKESVDGKGVKLSAMKIEQKKKKGCC